MTTGLRAALSIAMFLFAACRGERTTNAPIVPIRNMYDQPRYDTQQASPFFSDGRVMRPLLAGVVAQEMGASYGVETGRSDDGTTWLLEIPPAAAQQAGGLPALAMRGSSRFGIYCAPCHGSTGQGDGMVAQRAAQVKAVALKPPVSFHDDRIRHMPDGQLYATIRNGIRNMPAYGHSIPVQDRWAIVAYIRALQVQQAAARKHARVVPTQGVRP